MPYKKSELNKLNHVLDEAINEALLDTVDRFNMDDYSFNQMDGYEDDIPRYGEPEEDSTPNFKKPTVVQRTYYPDGNYRHGYSSANYPGAYNYDDDYEEPRKFRKGDERVILGDYQPPDTFSTKKYEKEEKNRPYQEPYSKDTYNTQYGNKDASVIDLDYLRQKHKLGEPENYQGYKTSDEADKYQKPLNNETKTPPGNYQPPQRYYEYIPKPESHSKPERQYQTENKTEKTNVNFQSKQATAKTESQTSNTHQTTQGSSKKEEVNPANTLKVSVPHMIARTEWGALPPMGHIERVQAPAESIVFSLNTDTPECKTEKECHRAVKEIQARQMGEGLADIQYNFLVGGDGNMYEGRGWGLVSGVPQEKSGGTNYNIAFIGSFQDDTNKIPPEMLGPVQDLVVYAKMNKYVIGDKMVKEMKKPKIEM